MDKSYQAVSINLDGSIGSIGSIGSPLCISLLSSCQRFIAPNNPRKSKPLQYSSQYNSFTKVAGWCHGMQGMLGKSPVEKILRLLFNVISLVNYQ